MGKAFRFYFMNIIVGLLILIIFSVIFVCEFCIVREVSVEGNTIYSDVEIVNFVLDGDYPDNTVYEFFYNLIKPKKDIPFVESVEVTLTSYNRIKIKVTEKSCVGYITLTDGTYAYFDEDAIVQEVSARLVDSAIPIGGITLDSAEVGQELDLRGSQVDLIVLLLKAEAKYEIEVKDISFDEGGNAIFTTGAVSVIFGDEDYFEEKMMRLAVILPKLDGQAGTLHLENYTPDSTDIVFNPAEESTEESAEESSEESAEESTEESSEELTEESTEESSGESTEESAEE